jgi:hypothetical protein
MARKRDESRQGRKKSFLHSQPVFLAVCLMSSALAPAAENPPRPLVGAIRWDAWYGNGSVVAEVERSLGPQKFHFRLPFFARVLSPSQVGINGDSAAIMEQEIDMAAGAGLNYWAFVDYWDDPGLTLGLRRYLASPAKRGLGFCFIEEGARLDELGTNGWPRLVKCFQDTNYVKVLDGRPLLFVFGPPRRIGMAEFQALGNAAVAAGLEKPYCVFMGWNPEADAKEIRALGFDAISAYAAGGQYAGEMPSYEELTGLVRTNYWEVCRRLQLPAVTFATAGWDARPRIEHPPSWCPWVKAVPDPVPPAQQQPLMDAVTANPQQLARHLQDAIEWTRRNRSLDPANVIIVYGWNENDEGGWLIPTLKPDGRIDRSRLDAISRVLNAGR